MKQLIPMLFLLLSFSAYANGNAKGLRIHASPGPDPLQLSIAEKLWLFCRVFSLSKTIDDYGAEFKTDRLSVSYFRRDSLSKSNGLYSLTELVELVLKDFILCDASKERLSLQKKADIMSAAIGWPGFLAVDSLQHFVMFDYTVLRKEYSKRIMKDLADRIAALTYSWLLRTENIKKWTMQVHFSKQNKNRINPLPHIVYEYVGEVYFHSIPDPTFDEALATQLKKRTR